MAPAIADTFTDWSTQGDISSNGTCVQFSYTQGTVTKSYPINVTVTGVSFTVTIDNSITNKIGNDGEVIDAYSVSMDVQSDGATVDAVSVVGDTKHGPQPITLTSSYAGAVSNAIVSIIGIDNGYWAGYYGPVACDPAVSYTAAPAPEPTPTDTPTAQPTETPTVPSFPNNSVHATGDEWGQITLTAPDGMEFTSVYFANYGLPVNYTVNPDCSADVTNYVAEAFVGKTTGTVDVTNVAVNGDPCYGVGKHMSIILIYGAMATPEPTPTQSESPTVTPTPTPTPTETPTVEPTPTPTPTETPTAVPTPTASPEPSPTPMPEPVPPTEPTPDPDPQPPVPPIPPAPNPEPDPVTPIDPTPTPDPVDPVPVDPAPTPDPTPVDPTPTPEPPHPPAPDPKPPVTPPTPSTPEKAPETPPVAPEKPADKTAVAEALVQAAAGKAVSAADIEAAGLTYADLPPKTPVDIRTDENGNPVVITAEVADALTVLENPAALVGALFTDPAKALMALGNIGADMSPQERKEVTKVVVASIIAGNAAISAAGISLRK